MSFELLQYGSLLLFVTGLCGYVAAKHTNGKDFLPFGVSPRDRRWYGGYFLLGTLFGLAGTISTLLYYAAQGLGGWMVVIAAPSILIFFFMGVAIRSMNNPINSQ